MVILRVLHLVASYKGPCSSALYQRRNGPANTHIAPIAERYCLGISSWNPPEKSLHILLGYFLDSHVTPRYAVIYGGLSKAIQETPRNPVESLRNSRRKLRDPM